MAKAEQLNSIAIIGASKNHEKFGNKCVRAYKKLGWKIFPVNPKEKEIEGLHCFPSILALPEKPSLVSVYLPPAVTISIIPELKKSGVKEAILNPGAESKELIEALKAAGINAVLVCSFRLQGLKPEDFP